jgi:hypothetical protein
MKRKKVIFTLVDRDSPFLRIWVKYYSELLGQENIVIVYENVTGFDIYEWLENNGFNNITVIENSHKNGKYTRGNHLFNDIQQQLFETNDVVVYADIDEIIFHPDLSNILETFETPYLTTTGFEIIHNCNFNTYREGESFMFEPKKRTEQHIVINAPLFDQRKYGMFSHFYDKPLILREPLHWDSGGKHNKGTTALKIDNLLLVHLNKMDFDLLNNLNKQNKKLFEDVLPHNALEDEDLLMHFKTHFLPNLIAIPDVIKDNLNI